MAPHTTEIRTRYAETDSMGVVYHAHFFTYFEAARTEFLRSLGTAYREMEAQGFFLVVVEAECTYHASAHYDDELLITSEVTRLRPTRVDFRHQVRRKTDSRLAAEGRIVLACVSSTGRPCALPPEVREQLTAEEEEE